MFRNIVLLAAGILTIPQLVLAAPRTFAELAELLVDLIDTGTGILIVFAVVVYFWGISSNIIQFDEDPEKRKAYFFWGVLVLFLMVSVWGVVQLLANTLFGSGSYRFGGGETTVPAQTNPFSDVNINFGE